MRRLKVLLVCNNQISKIGSIGASLPNLQAIVLTNNKIYNLFEIDNLSNISNLQYLSFMENPVCLKANYRLYAIYRLPCLKVLDFIKVTKAEKEYAIAFFESVQGKAFINAVNQEKTIARSDQTVSSSVPRATIRALQLSEEQKVEVRRAIEKASTKEEIDLIEQQLHVRSSTIFIH
jgi:U2 small nuclear ribonucleoprotein A'